MKHLLSSSCTIVRPITVLYVASNSSDVFTNLVKLSVEFVIGLGNRKIVTFRLVRFVWMTTYYASRDTMDRYKCIQLRTMEDTSCFGCKGIYLGVLPNFEVTVASCDKVVIL